MSAPPTTKAMTMEPRMKSAAMDPVAWSAVDAITV